jgi:1,2-diacylglycerol 3-beta-galactosyltransferase
MPERRKRVLILMADYGYGHRSAANAIAEALRDEHGTECHVDIVNPLEDERAPAFFRETQTNYDEIVRQRPNLYKLGDQIYDLPGAGNVIEGALTLLLFNVLRRILRRHWPDVVVCTYPTYQAILATIFAVQKRRVPVITVVTDLATVPRLWFHPIVARCLVPTQTVFDLALEAGLPPEKVKITGIPVHPDLARNGDERASLRAGLGWQPDVFTVLAIGSKRVANLVDALRVLNHSGLPLQLAVVAGGDDELFRELKETDWHREAYVYNFVSDMPSLLKAADCVLGKAGGLTVTEALACGLPLILVDVIPGQETGNAEFVIDGNAGELAREPAETLEILCHWLERGGELYQARARSASQLGRPRAAHDVAQVVWAAATRSIAAELPPPRKRWRPRRA